ncbi:MAG TPA: diacylglycerol kinase [Steroidobacteraceae bacterium]|nr:diacylglycerol kinase [Steroidobacteraceae bacterium]
MRRPPSRLSERAGREASALEVSPAGLDTATPLVLQAIAREKPGGLTRILRAFAASRRGFTGAFREEAAFRQELALAAIVIPLGLWLGRSGVERALLVAPMLLILVVELLNSAIEATVDRIGFERHALAGLAKDMGSAAVLMSFVLLGAVWLTILLGH